MAFSKPTYSELQTAIQEELQDTSVATLATIKILINRVYRYLISKISQKKRDYFLTSKSVSITANKAEYSIETDFSITDMKEFVMIKDEDDDKVFRGDLRRTRSGYYLIGHKTLGLIPTPTASATYKIYYIQQPDNMTTSSNVPIIPCGEGDIFIPGVCADYYRLKKQNAMSANYKNDFVDKMGDMLMEISEDASDELKEVEPIEDEELENIS